MKNKFKRNYFFIFICVFLQLSHIINHPALSEPKLKCKSITECKKCFEQTAKSFLGTSYCYGSSNKNGFDCSGLVLKMIDALFEGANLPRRSQDIYSFLSETVTLSNARMGDLLFFKTRNTKSVNHIGIFWKSNEKGKKIMYHASSSRGVEMKELNQYWMSRLIGIKRFPPLTNALNSINNSEKAIKKQR
ncbi:MAG: NlpC/P60 family protein [Candidatus Caenarcaniphilales bacterium]|nr:NlpC/P60 family protein [Candidatus Caenarcaniphilales bacterium]